MTRAERNRLKVGVTAAGILWMVVVGWLMWVTLPEGAVETHTSDPLKDRMSQCTGSFRDRYDCKEQIIIQSGREAFYTLSLRFLLVIVPPMIGTLSLSRYLARHPVPVIEEPQYRGTSASPQDWKERARLHTQVQTPAEAAQALHLSPGELPEAPLHSRPRLDDIAPMEDWKERARSPKRSE